MKSASYTKQLQELLLEIEAEYKYTCCMTGRPVPSSNVIKAMTNVPRHKFVPTPLRDRAYENIPLPIGLNQTISQPYIVAIMTDLLDLDSDSTVLEIGTGCGYQAAVLAEIARQVYSIEIIEQHAQDATQRLQKLGYKNVTVRFGDGHNGWPEFAPFDAIIVTAAAKEIPVNLVRQLAPGGKLIAPVETHYFRQQLLLISKKYDESTQVSEILDVAFVLMTGGP